MLQKAGSSTASKALAMQKSYCESNMPSAFAHNYSEGRMLPGEMMLTMGPRNPSLCMHLIAAL